MGVTISARGYLKGAYMVKLVAVAFLLAFLPRALSAEEARPPEKANIARVMWSAFSCATFAGLSGNNKEQERLFELGYKSGKTFVDGVKNKTITETEAKEAPVGVLWHMGGPTTDFIIGRIFEAASDDAYDEVVKTDGAGLRILDPSKWADDELKVMKARNKYQASNCTLVR